MARNNQMKLSVLSIPENVPLARVAVAAFASQLEFTLEDLEEIKVAVSEAVSNSIIHGYKNCPDLHVDISCSITDDILEITVEDQGDGIQDIEQAMQPTFSTESARMGLGFTFMQSFMDDLQVESTVNSGTKVRMKKHPIHLTAVKAEAN